MTVTTVDDIVVDDDDDDDNDDGNDNVVPTVLSRYDTETYPMAVEFLRCLGISEEQLEEHAAHRRGSEEVAHEAHYPTTLQHVHKVRHKVRPGSHGYHC